MATDRQSVVAPPDSSRDYPALGRLWQVPVFVLGLLAILGVWASQRFWNDPDVRVVKQALAEARRVLEDPKAPANTLPGTLADALDHVQRCPQRAGEVHFLLGWAYARLAGRAARDCHADLWSLCRQQLELANHLGVPDSDISHLCYFLGKAWFQTGADAKLVIAALEASIDAAADNRGEGYAMLAQAYLRLPEPDLAHALEANRKQLDQPVADENLLAPARLLRGELLLRMHDREGARKALSRIASTAPAGIVAVARRLQARSYQEDEAWGDAARYWETILAEERDKASDRPSMLFSLGWCYRNQHRFDEAARVWEQAAHAAGEEGQAACLRLAELCTETGKFLQALDLLEDALTGVKNPEQYRNNLVSLAQARGILEAGCNVAQKAGDFSDAERLAQFNLRLAVPPAGQVLLGQILEAWCQAQREQAQKATADKAARHEEEARLHCQQAGKFFEAAAGMIADKTPKLDHLWRAARDYADGQDFEDAAAVLGRYLTLAPPPEKLAEAWYRLGQAMQALAEACQHLGHTMEGIEKTAQAVRSFNNCIGSPSSSFAFRARYELALIEVQ
ncbi:MAG TPA: hypothetical protein VGY58_04740, partial [Gemmataceae bacterium]|nr:hypothetical protein [Gemmataceae bacterium]